MKAPLYHAHIYFDSSTQESAEALRKKIVFTGLPRIYLSHMREEPVGPHPLPMFEVNFKSEHLGAWMIFLHKERGVHNILLHEVTGDDPRDHTLGAYWFEGRLPLDFSKLDPSPKSDEEAYKNIGSGLSTRIQTLGKNHSALAGVGAEGDQP